MLPVVSFVQESLPAASAGIRALDTILSVEGRPIQWFNQISPILQEQGEHSIAFQVKRGDSIVSLSIHPRYLAQDKRYVVGISGQLVLDADQSLVRCGPGAAVHKAARKFGKDVRMMYEFVKYLFAKQLSVKTMGGPVVIVTALGMVSMTGLDRLVFLLAMISINLAVINLIPFLIISDGGLISFFLLERIRGKPLQIKTQMMIQKVAMSLIVLLFLFVTCNDIHRLFRWFGR